MPARHFTRASNEYVRFPPVGTLGACTILTVAKRASDGVSMHPFKQLDSVTNPALSVGTSTNNLVMFVGGTGSTTTQTFTVADGWCILAFTRTAGAAQTPRGHKCVLSTGAWSHANGATALSNPTDASGAYYIGGDPTLPANMFDGRIVAQAYWNTVLTDLELEAIGSVHDILNTQPANLLHCVQLDQDVVTGTVQDMVSGRGVQVARVGTTVVADEPPNFPLVRHRIGVPDVTPAADVVEYHMRDRTNDEGYTFSEQYLINVDERVASYKGMASSFRLIGAGNTVGPVTTQNLMSIENTAGSGVLLALKRMSCQSDQTSSGATGDIAIISASRPASFPTGGTVLSKVPFDTAKTSNAGIVIRGGNASDGGAATAIVGTPGTRFWRQYVENLVGGSTGRVEQLRNLDNAIVPQIAAKEPVILAPGESILVEVAATVADIIDSTRHWLLNIMWEEFTLP